MRIVTVFGASAVLICGFGDLASAAHPPLDRPTPPPCCADGVCYPNPHTYGWYATRWRRWPTDTVQTVPAAPSPIDKLGPDIKPYDPPPAEQEDRRAPPPTPPRAEADEEPAGTPETSPVAPPSEGGVAPSPGGPAAPGPVPGPAVPPPTRMPWENGDEPTGDWDPPPTLPITSAAATAHHKIVPQLGRPIAANPQSNIGSAAKPAASAPARSRTTQAGDPPPSLPVTLASATY